MPEVYRAECRQKSGQAGSQQGTGLAGHQLRANFRIHGPDGNYEWWWLKPVQVLNQQTGENETQWMIMTTGTWAGNPVGNGGESETGYDFWSKPFVTAVNDSRFEADLTYENMKLKVKYTDPENPNTLPVEYYSPDFTIVVDPPEAPGPGDILPGGQP